MTVLFILLGILFVVSGFSYIFTPLHNYLAAGYFAVILIVAFGIIGIIRAIAQKRFGVNFVFSILSVLMGIIMLVFPKSFIVAQTMMLIMTAIWLILMGILTIVDAVRLKKATGSKIWIPLLIFGILNILFGCVSFYSPIYLAITIGFMIAIYFIETGFTLIFSGFLLKD